MSEQERFALQGFGGDEGAADEEAGTEGSASEEAGDEGAADEEASSRCGPLFSLLDARVSWSPWRFSRYKHGNVPQGFVSVFFSG